MARLPQPGGDEGSWGSILNDYLAQTLNADGSLKSNSVGTAQLQSNSVTNAALAADSVNATTIADGTVTETQLDTPTRAKLNSAPNALLLSDDQTAAGYKTFSDAVFSPVIRAVAPSSTNYMQVSGGVFPSLAAVTQDGTIKSQIITDVDSGSMFVDYTDATGGSFYVRSSPQTGSSMLTINTTNGAVFGSKVTAPSLQISGGSPDAGKVLTSDATGNATWQMPASPGSGSSIDDIKLKELYQPIIGVIPTSEVTQDQYFHDDVDSGTFVNMTGTLWNSPEFNTQSQKLVAVNGSNPAFGCTNMSNGRQIGSILDIEFEFTGDKFAIHMQAFGYYDTQIYVEHEGQMMKIKSYPLADDYSGFTFRSIKFSRYATRRIRIILPFLYFLQIIHESNAVVKKTPNRPMIAITGDSYVDASTGYNAGSSRSYVTAGVVDAIIEATGFAVLRLGQGGTGYFNNASGVASDALGPADASRFFSSQRLTSLQATGPGSLTALVVNGTINDGELSGGTAAMKARALAGYQAVTTWDPGVSIIAVTPEPLGNPTVGGVHDLNRIAIIQAIDEHPQGIGVVDVFDPASPLWTGTGTEASPEADQQTKLVGMDGIHGNWAGYKLYGHYISMKMGEMKIPIERAWL